jgi:hypothetical protein
MKETVSVTIELRYGVSIYVPGQDAAVFSKWYAIRLALCFHRPQMTGQQIDEERDRRACGERERSGGLSARSEGMYNGLSADRITARLVEGAIWASIIIQLIQKTIDTA